MVHHSNARIQVLAAFILEHVADYKSHFTISDVKQDGTVFVKFRGVAKGSYGAAATDLAYRFATAMRSDGKLFAQTSDVQFRLALDQFAV